jgi:hypothetical protein
MKIITYPQGLSQPQNSYITLEAIRDSATHVSILPRTTMSVSKYEAALANTQKYVA